MAEGAAAHPQPSLTPGVGPQGSPRSHGCLAAAELQSSPSPAVWGCSTTACREMLCFMPGSVCNAQCYLGMKYSAAFFSLRIITDKTGPPTAAPAPLPPKPWAASMASFAGSRLLPLKKSSLFSKACVCVADTWHAQLRFSSTEIRKKRQQKNK